MSERKKKLARKRDKSEGAPVEPAAGDEAAPSEPAPEPEDMLVTGTLDTPEAEEPPDPAEAVEQPTPDELSSLPLTTAASLLPSEEEETPPEPQASEPPLPGERHGKFIVQETRGQGEGFRVLIEATDGETYIPLGTFLHYAAADLDGDQVFKLLVEDGLPPQYAQSFARQRQRRLEGSAAIAGNPALKQAAEMEERHVEIKDAFSRAFVERQKRERGKK